MGRSDSFFAFWGKAGSRLDDDSGDYHLLPYHCLDEAAVGSALVERHPALQGTLIRMLHVEPKTVKSWITFFLAVHDLGKFAETFQNLRPDLFERLLERKTSR